MTYPRFGVPSASSIRRVWKCKGSHKRERGLPDTDSRDATFGTRVAAAMAETLPESELTPAERNTFERCVDAEERTLADWGGLGDVTITREVRLGLTVLNAVVVVTPDTGATFKFTGQYDFLAIMGDSALLKDDKALYGDIAEAVDNEQINTLAVLVWLRHKVKEVRCVINQPNVGPPSAVDLKEEDLQIRLNWLLQVLKTAEDASRDDVTAWTPDDEGNDWCRYCKAKLGCPAWLARSTQPLEVMQPMMHAHLEPKALWSAMSEIARDISDEELIGRYRGLAMVRAYPEVIKAEMARRAESPDFPFQMRAVRELGNREIEDAQAAFDRLAPLGVTAEDMLAAAKVRIGPLEEAVRIRSGIKSQGKVTRYNKTGSEAKKALNEALEGIMTRKDPPLELVEVKQLNTSEE